MNIEDLAREIAFKQNAYQFPDIVYHGTPYTGNILNYDPSYAFTGEGANIYGISHYSTDMPEVANKYATMKGTPGQVLTEYVPSRDMYYDFNKPLSEQSEFVKKAVEKSGLKNPTRDIMSFKNQMLLNKFPEEYMNSVIAPNNKRVYLEEAYANYLRNPLPEYPILETPAGAGDYQKILTELDKQGVAGIRRPITNNSGVNVGEVIQTIRPENIEIHQPYEVGKRTYAPLNKVTQSYNNIMGAVNKAKQIATPIIENPYIKPLLRAGGTALKAGSIVGDIMLGAELIRMLAKENPKGENRGTIPTRGVGLGY